MRPPELATAIPGSGAVHEWFGRWPSFHDAEVVSLHLARAGASSIQVYPYFPERPATVEFVLEEITDLKLEDFSQQNVVGGLSVGPALMPDGGDGYRLRIFSLFGIGGHVDARRIRMNLIPDLLRTASVSGNRFGPQTCTQFHVQRRMYGPHAACGSCCAMHLHGGANASPIRQTFG